MVGVVVVPGYHVEERESVGWSAGAGSRGARDSIGRCDDRLYSNTRRSVPFHTVTPAEAREASIPRLS